MKAINGVRKDGAYHMSKQMKILVINPNTSEEMTKQIEEQILSICSNDVELTVLSNQAGPISIEGHLDEIVSAYQMLNCINFEEEYDGYLIACFSNHPAIGMLREITGKPVIGIAEGACHMASLLGYQFSVVTTSPKWVPMLTEAVSLFGLRDKLVGVFSSGLSVESLHCLPEKTVEEEIINGAKRSIDIGSEVICLGCAGMSGMKEKLEKELDVPVIDACEAGFMMLYSLCKMQINTSRKCMYEKVMPRKITGCLGKIENFYK